MAETVKDDWLDDLDSSEDKPSELDQSDIDVLLSGTGDQGSPASGSGRGEEEDSEFDQSAIDALLSDSDETMGAGLESGDLDQSDIDSLLASPKATTQGQTATDPDQDEIDKLFSDIDTTDMAGDNPFPADEIDFKDVFDSPDPVTQADITDFDAEEFKLDADIPDIPETNDFDFGAPSPSFDDTVAAASTLAEPTTIVEPGPDTGQPTAEQDNTAKVRNILGNRKVLLGMGAGLVVLLIVTGGLFFRNSPEPAQEGSTTEVAVQPPATHGTDQPPAALHPPPEPVQAQNAAPTVTNLDLTMPPGSTQLAITLSGADPENAPLEYEFQSMPEHGQLAGHAPNLIYTPKPDYCGLDSFTVRATDGKSFSPPATVTITRQPPVTVAAIPPPPLEAPRAEPAVLCPPDSTESTKSKQESIRAKESRFRLGKRETTNKKTARVAAKRKNRAPVIHLQPIAPVFTPGDTVVMNASSTTDNNRNALTFEWQQLGGVPVLVKPLNSEGSQVSFVVPSTFNTVSNPTLHFKVTATNQVGAYDSKEISILTKSRRHSAIWRGN